MDYELEKKYHISFCGSYCHICDWHTGKIRRIYQAAGVMLREFGFKKLLEGKVDIDNFKTALDILAYSSICPGCKAPVLGEAKKDDRCQIRQCAVRKGFDLCNECEEFPCALLKENPGVVKFHCIENLREIKKKGLHRWIDEQWEKHTSRE